jgi:hypothetical protein
VGLVCNKSGLQFGIPTKPFSYRNTGNKSVIKVFDIIVEEVNTL